MARHKIIRIRASGVHSLKDMMKPEIQKLSYSSVALWNYCPRAWLLRYHYKYVTPSSAAQVFGTAMHKAIQTSLVEKRDLSSMAAGFQNQVFSAIFDNKIAIRANDVTTLVISGQRILNDPMIGGILGTIKVEAESQVEREFEFRVPNVRPPVMGFIDIVDNDGIPYDIKTSKWQWTDGKAMEETQPDFYLTALEDAGTPSPDAKFTYIIVMKTEEPFAYLIETQRPNYKERTYELVQKMWEGVKTREWENECARPACKNCGLAKECGRLKL